MEPLNTDRVCKLLASFWAVIAVILYISFTIDAGTPTNVVVKLVHICLIIPSVMVMMAVSTAFDWVDKWIYIIYTNMVGLITVYLSLIIVTKTYTGYIPVITELLGIGFIMVGGAVISLLASLPFKLIQAFYYDLAWYDHDFKQTPVQRERVKVGATLAGMNETQLQVELNLAIKAEDYERASRIREELKRFK